MCSLVYCGQAVDWNKTNWWRQVFGFDFFKQIWIPICPERKHSAIEWRPAYIIHGPLVLVTLKCRLGLNHVKGTAEITWHTTFIQGRKLWIRFDVFKICFHQAWASAVRFSSRHYKKLHQRCWSSNSSHLPFVCLVEWICTLNALQTFLQHSLKHSYSETSNTDRKQ